MKPLLTPEMIHGLPKLYEQEAIADPIVHARFFFPAGSWIWLVTEGENDGDDFLFFGHVIGFESEWGYFTLRELEEVNVAGFMIQRDEMFEPCSFSFCSESGIAPDEADEKEAADKNADTESHPR